MPPNQVYLPVEGMLADVSLLVPEVLSLGANAYDTMMYAQENGLTSLSVRDSYVTALLCRRKEPTYELVERMREQSERKNLSLTENDILVFLGNLREQIWKNYQLRHRENLLWVSGVSCLIKDYTVDVKDGTHSIKRDETKPVAPINWLKNDGRMTDEMAKTLGIEKLTKYFNAIDVFVDSNHHTGEAMRALYSIFRLNANPGLYSDRNLSYALPELGCLYGKKLEKEPENEQ